MTLPDTAPDLALAAIHNGAARGGPPWDARTAARHEHDGHQWAVVIDWARSNDDTPIPAAVTLTSLGGTFGDPIPAGVVPQAVTRALVESVSWATVIWGSRKGAQSHAEHLGQSAARYSQPPTHDEHLRLVARLYSNLGGNANRTVALDVLAHLELLDLAPGGEPASQRATVRRWLKECRDPRRGYLPLHKNGGTTK